MLDLVKLHITLYSIGIRYYYRINRSGSINHKLTKQLSLFNHIELNKLFKILTIVMTVIY